MLSDESAFKKFEETFATPLSSSKLATMQELIFPGPAAIVVSLTPEALEPTGLLVAKCMIMI